jgi:surface polysaccharide O-acyltransferase-like enzyme
LTFFAFLKATASVRHNTYCFCKPLVIAKAINMDILNGKVVSQPTLSQKALFGIQAQGVISQRTFAKYGTDFWML